VRIAVVGGGPGGLYFACLWKKRHPEAQIDLFEQNPAGATWGFGVVFSEQALEFLRADDPDTVDAIAPRMESWKNITLNLHGESVEIDGVGFSSIGRLELLTILQARVRAVEEGLPLVRAANTGISTVVDPYGRNIAVTQLGESTMIEARLPASIALPFYAQWRVLVFLLSLAVCMLAIATKILYRASAL